MDPGSYAPLRVHGHHTLLTGVDSPARLLERAAQLQLPALALADVDSLAGLHEFLRASDTGVRRIVAAEISAPEGEPGRLIALVRDERGYRNLCKLVSARQLGGDPGAPDAKRDAQGAPERFDLASSAARYREGLTYLVDHPRLAFALHERVSREHLLVAIAPACLKRTARARVDRVRPGEARNAALAPAPRGSDTPSSRGPVHRPGELDAAERAEDEEARLCARKVPAPARPASADELIETARALDLATLAVPDTYCADERGRVQQRLRAAIKHNALIHDLPARWLASAPAHLQGAGELEPLYEDLPDLRGPFEASHGLHGMLARTLELAESCQYLPPLGRVLFPAIELAPGQSAYSRLAELSFAGALARYRPLRIEVVRRLDYELCAIEQLGFAPYFLLVKRIADWAHEQKIPCVGRGSAADSLVAYCLMLTDADPLRYRLPFERFLNPSRKDRPDIDLDFCWRRRDEVLEHVYAAFGPERTAMICTLNRFGARAAFREAALALGLPPAEINPWSRRMPHEIPASAARGSSGGSLAEALRAVPECRGLPFADERVARALRAADELLDEPRHFGLHPGGVVVSPGPITDYVSCQRAAKGVVMTQLDKDGVEALGLVKMDLLGNRALTVIADCEELLAARGIDPKLGEIAENDERTATLLREGRTLGCSQVESPGLRNLLVQTRAQDMDAVIQAVALIRPGPSGSGMKDAYVRRLRGLEAPEAPHPRLTELLWDTRGVMLYQEDVMQVALHLAGMDLAEADRLRRALQKRRSGELVQLKERFEQGCRANGVDPASIARVWELISNFSSFGFCKAHAVTYGRIGYRCVYLKAHWPAAYLVSFLKSETGYYESRVYVEEARRLGVRILGPDINRSAASYALEAEDGLRLGLGQVKGLSQATLERIVVERERAGAFLSLPDFLERARPATDEAENLIECGALDAFDRTRPELLWRLHLLRAPSRRAPAGAGLDALALDACRATPRQREQEGGGWGRSIGLSQTDLAPGETKELFAEPRMLFAEPQAPQLALPRLPDQDERARALKELELLGVAVRLHPVRIFPDTEEAYASSVSGKLWDARDSTARPTLRIPCGELARHTGETVELRGWLAASRRVRTKRGEWMRFLSLEDESGMAEVVLWPDVYRRLAPELAGRGPFTLRGKVMETMGACSLQP